MTGDDVRWAASAVRELLDHVPDGDASVPVMEAPVVAVAEHIAGTLGWYAHDLVAGPEAVWPAEWTRLPDASLAVLAKSVSAWGEVLARTVEASPAGERGWHPYGRADAAGFAAMGCAEALIHGHDIADGIGLPWFPPADVAGRVLERLFPDVDVDAPPMTALLWATGRIELPGRPRRSSWGYTAAPLDDLTR